MTKAEQFIKDYTRDCSNEIVPVKDGDKHLYHEWLTPEQALRAIEIERDELLEKACDWLSDNLQTIVDVDCPSKHHVESIPVLGSITQTEFLRKFREEIKYLFD